MMEVAAGGRSAAAGTKGLPMPHAQQPTGTVIGFDQGRARVAPRREPHSLMEAVFSEGSVLLRADDRPARIVAAMLGRLGFFIIEEIRPDGACRLAAGALRLVSGVHPWRVSKADLSGADDLAYAPAGRA